MNSSSRYLSNSESTITPYRRMVVSPLSDCYENQRSTSSSARSHEKFQLSGKRMKLFFTLQILWIIILNFVKYCVSCYSDNVQASSSRQTEVDKLSTEQNITECINQNAPEIDNDNVHLQFSINNVQSSDMVDSDNEEVWLVYYNKLFTAIGACYFLYSQIK